MRPHTRCRICSEKLSEPYLTLGKQPLANALRNGDGTPEATYPLEVALCKPCNLSQLTVVVSPEILYDGYRFRSGQSELWRTSCAELAERVTRWQGKPTSMLDIAANDGTLVKAFRKLGWAAIGVDPSPADKCVFKGYWTKEWAQDHGFGEGQTLVDLVVAQNVLGHVDDPISFLKAIKFVLRAHGRCVIEVPDVREMVERVAFDTIYHEHLSYWSKEAMREAAHRAGLQVEWSKPLEIHGGSRRYFLTHAKNTLAVSSNADLPDYRHFAAATFSRLRLITTTLKGIRAKHQTLAAFGASAKGAVALNALKEWGNTVWPSYVIDDCKEKQGFYLPGVDVPIVPMPETLKDVDVLMLLSWNNADDLRAKARERGFQGQFLVNGKLES